jgi:hemoglobin
MEKEELEKEDRSRSSVQARIRAMGIDEVLIDRVVDTFYLRIRDDSELGPIFNGVIDDWDPHLAKMKDFWSSVVLYTGKYSGKPMPIHRQLIGVEPRHFAHWLNLFRKTLEDVAPSEEVVDHFMLRAEQIARTLQAGMYRPQS